MSEGVRRPDSEVEAEDGDGEVASGASVGVGVASASAPPAEPFLFFLAMTSSPSAEPRQLRDHQPEDDEHDDRGEIYTHAPGANLRKQAPNRSVDRCGHPVEHVDGLSEDAFGPPVSQ